MKQQTMEKVFEDQLKDLYSAEVQLTKALPKMAQKASTEELRTAIENHLEETREHVGRLETIGEELEMKLTGKKCKAMEGLIEEGKEALEHGSSLTTDVMIIGAAQKVEHYEISAYGTAAAIAEQLGLDDAVKTLRQTLEEESAADTTLTEICEESVFPQIENSEEETQKGTTGRPTSRNQSRSSESHSENRR